MTEEVLLRNAEVLRLQRPSRHVADSVKHYVCGEDTRKKIPSLGGASMDIYDTEDSRRDLVSLAPRQGDDRLTNLLTDCFPMLWRRRSYGFHEIDSLSERRLEIVVIVINAIVAAAMLLGAIFSRYYIHGNEKRLGILTAFTVMFSVCVSLLTNAKRSEIFGATAAYGAVLVVFVSGNLGNG